ncbi:type II toxin-antitoxin system RelB/DinJ family antitoxin [Haemophilus haemolyticus]|uniref:RelB n=1 Tax=Haemophilus haemolyticus M19501 TaxID=1028803 RepID=F9GQ39_HAEHA|nr:type II toxin-antitoxin system RelB/DinJ family antitoxin [Haemophilus haemolyticus]EGT75126.1 RelB [Haemophilus haemolyticus M19501]
MGAINFNIRMDENLKERAFPVIESYGLTPAQAVKLFFNQIAITQCIPISFEHNAKHIPNAITRQAIEDAEAEFHNAQRYKTIEEAIMAMQDLVK